MTIFQIKYKLELLDLSKDVVEELLRYVYTDRVDNLDTLAPQLISLSLRFQMQGLNSMIFLSTFKEIFLKNKIVTQSLFFYFRIKRIM